MLTEIGPLTQSPGEADIVIVGGPVWAFTIAPAVRTFLTRYAGELNRVAFFCTQGGSGGSRALREMATVSGKQPLATLIVNERDVKSGSVSPRIAAFVAQIQHGSDGQ